MALQGKGFYIWEIPRCEGGDPNAIAAMAKSAGLTHAVVKICDGTINYPGKWKHPTDLVPAVVEALKTQGIQVWGWHYVYGKNPVGEADIAIQRIHQLGVAGYVIDAEKEYKEMSNRAEVARQFMNRLRGGLSGIPIALSSYRYPSLHPQLPWSEFLSKCDINMPQVYWKAAHNAGQQLTKSYNEFKVKSPSLPYIPTGAAFTESGWSPTVGEVNEFLQTALNLGLPAANFWEWGDVRSGKLPGLWEAIRDFAWGGTPQPPVSPGDIVDKLMAALNAHDPNQAAALYGPSGGHVSPDGPVAGSEAIKAWFTRFFAQGLPDAIFTLTSPAGSGAVRTITWTANSSFGKILDGRSTLHLSGDKIAMHTMLFTVSH